MRHFIISRYRVFRMIWKLKGAIFLLGLLSVVLVMTKYPHIDVIPGAPMREQQDLKQEQVQGPVPREFQMDDVTAGNTVGLRTTHRIDTDSSPHYDVEEMQKQRRISIQNTCASVGADMNSTMNLTDRQLSGLDYIHVIPQFKLLYCSIPKAGCTSWKRLILDLTGYGDVLADMQKENNGISAHEAMLLFFPPLSKLDPHKAREALSTHKSFMFVRNPYTRVLSAYRDKILLDKHSKWRDALLEWMVNDDPQAASDVFLGKRNATFEEFLRFYLSPVNNNPHWREYYRLCMPCLVKYDFVGKFETMAEDSSSILESMFHVNSSIGLSKSKRITNSSSKGILRDFYSSIPKDLLMRISKHGGFTTDSKLFGYDAPEVIQDLLH